MKRWMMFLVVLMAMAPHAHADEASKRAKVKELFVVMKLDATMEKLTHDIMGQMKAAMNASGGPSLTPDQKKIVDQYEDRVFKLVTDEMGWKAIEPQYEDIYVNTYSEDEIDGILAFYKSPAGKAMVQKTPELMDKSNAISKEKMVELQPKIRAMVEEMVREMTKDLPSVKLGTPKSPSPR